METFWKFEPINNKTVWCYTLDPDDKNNNVIDNNLYQYPFNTNNNVSTYNQFTKNYSSVDFSHVKIPHNKTSYRNDFQSQNQRVC